MRFVIISNRITGNNSLNFYRIGDIFLLRKVRITDISFQLLCNKAVVRPPISAVNKLI